MAPLRCIGAALLVLLCQLAPPGVSSESPVCSPTAVSDPLLATTSEGRGRQQGVGSTVEGEQVLDSQGQLVGCRAGYDSTTTEKDRATTELSQLPARLRRDTESEDHCSERDYGSLGQPMQGGHLSGRLEALDATLLEQEEFVLHLVRSLEAQRGQILELMEEIKGQDCFYPCRQLSEWHKQKTKSADGELKVLVEDPEETPPESVAASLKVPAGETPPVSVVAPLDVPGMPLSAVEGLVAFDAPESATGLVGYHERIVARPRVAWGDHFGLLAAVHVGPEVTALHTLPQESDDGLSQYIAVGDSNGGLHIFHTNGQLVWELLTASRSPVRSIVSYLKGPLETCLVTGHADGSLLLHSLLGVDPRGVAGGSKESETDPPETDLTEGPRLLSYGSLVDRGEGARTERTAVENRSPAQSPGEPDPVLILQKMQLGRTELLLVADSKGTLEIFDVPRHKRLAVLHKRSRILAFQQPLSSSRVVFVSRSGVGRVDLAGMVIHPVECPGLDGLTLDSFAFDVGAKSRGYGIVEGGRELVVVNVGGHGEVVWCELLARKKGAFNNGTGLHAFKGYLLARSETAADLFDTSSPRFGGRNVAGPRLVYTIPSADIVGAFNWQQAASHPDASEFPPPVATSKDRLVVLAFPGGLVAMYRSDLPVFRPPTLAANWLGSPILVGIILVVATWQILIRRPAQSPGTFSADGLGKWTEKDLREFVREHVNGGSHVKPPGDDQGRGLDRGLSQGLDRTLSQGLDRGLSRGLSRSSGSWRESPSSSRERSLDRIRERSLERRTEEKCTGVNAPPRDVHVDSVRVTGESGRGLRQGTLTGESVRVAGDKENSYRPPVSQGACARKEETVRPVLKVGVGHACPLSIVRQREADGKLPSDLSHRKSTPAAYRDDAVSKPDAHFKTLRDATPGAKQQVSELTRTMSLQLPPRTSESEAPLARSNSLSSTPGAQERAESIHTDLDTFLKKAGFVEFCGTQTMSRTASLKSDGGIESPGLDTTGGARKAPLPRSVGSVNAQEGGRFGGANEPRGGGEQAGGIPHFVAEDMVGETGAPEGVLGEMGLFRNLMSGGERKLTSAVSAEARDVKKFLAGSHNEDRLFEQPRSW